MLRSQLPAAFLVAVLILACGEEDPGATPADAGAGGTSGSLASAGAGAGGSSTGSGGSSGGAGGSTAGVGGVGGRCGVATGGGAGTGGAGGTGGSSAAGEAGVGGSGASAGGGGTGGEITAPSPECAGLEPNVGGIARPADFSLSEGVAHDHTLSMDRGSMIRRQLDYQTTGDSDHQHQVRFTDEQLVQLMAGETLVVETEGPPLNASSGHSHTVTVHPCLSP